VPERDDSRFFLAVLGGYKRLYRKVFKRPGLSLLCFLLLLPALLSIGLLLPTAGMPPLEQSEALVEIDWHAPIGAGETRDRVTTLQRYLEESALQAEADVGVGQFLLSGGDNSVQRASLYLRFADEEEKERQTAGLARLLAEKYPAAAVSITDAPNAFDQLFSSDLPYFEARWRDLETKRPVEG